MTEERVESTAGTSVRARVAVLARRHPFRTAVALAGIGIVSVLAAAVGWVQMSPRDRVYDLSDVPAAPVAVVFGAGLRPDGTPSPYLEARLASAAALYRADKVEAILVTGDHGRPDHDEVGAMRAWLLAHDVPGRAVVGDHAGFDTYDSCVRARRVFGVDHAILVTQDFHLPRALFSCRQAGIRTVGVAVPAVGGRPALNRTRELAASLKAAFDAVVDPGPRYLGPRETGIEDALDDR